MITAYIGKPGSGKSLRLAELAVRDLLAGRDVYTNFVIYYGNVLWYAWRHGYAAKWKIGPGAFWKRDLSRHLGRWRVMRTYEDMTTMREGRLYFDEAHMWLWARAWKDIPRRVISWWSQSRKHGVDVFYATQRYESVDAHVRELTSVTWHCRRIGNTNMFIYQMEDMESEDRRRRIWKRQMVRLDLEIAGCYDTYQVLDPPWEVAEREAAQASAASKRESLQAPRVAFPRQPAPNSRSSSWRGAPTVKGPNGPSSARTPLTVGEPR